MIWNNEEIRSDIRNKNTNEMIDWGSSLFQTHERRHR